MASPPGSRPSAAAGSTAPAFRRRSAPRSARRSPRRVGTDSRRLCPPSLHHEEAQLDALLAAVRRRPQRDAADDRRRDRSTTCSATCRPTLLLSGPIESLPTHASELSVERQLTALARKNMVGGRGALLPRLRRLQASHSGERRPHHPARRVPDRLHALSARDRAGHAAGPVRVPDPGRAALWLRGRQCVDVRRLDRLLGSDRHGAADHAADEGDPVVRTSPALRQRRDDDGEVHRRRRSETSLPELSADDRCGAS